MLWKLTTKNTKYFLKNSNFVCIVFWPICMYLVFWSITFSFICCCLCVGIIFSILYCVFGLLLVYVLFCFYFPFVCVFSFSFSLSFWVWFFSHVGFFGLGFFLIFLSSFCSFFHIVLLSIVVFLWSRVP